LTELFEFGASWAGDRAGCEAAAAAARTGACHLIIPDIRTQHKEEHFIHAQVACLEILEWRAECEAQTHIINSAFAGYNVFFDVLI